MNIGEAAISPSIQQAVAPDTTGQQGQSQLFQKAVEANKQKPVLDAVLKQVTDKVGGESSSRVKQIETMAAKIAQKRLANREYDIKDINDSLGGRIVLSTQKQINKAKDMINQMGKDGVFKINASEPVKTNDYRAFHYDITLPGGLPAEIQIHDKHSVATAVVNHDLRSIHGEDPKSDAVIQLRDTQAKMLNNMPQDKALSISKAIESIRKQNNNQPLDPRITAQVLSQAQ